MGGDSNEITRAYFDRILLKTRYIDSDLPDTGFELFGRYFDTPICTAALSHLNGTHEAGMVHLARGAAMANAVNFVGMESYEGETDDIVHEGGAATIRIIKPHADNREVLKRIDHAASLGVFGIGMDIDHAYRNDGTYDVVCDLPMHPKTYGEIKMFADEADAIPFIVKGVLSVEDALKCKEAGVAGIVVSHHHGIMPYSVPPLMVLPEIRRAVGNNMKIFVDCGIESGMDVFKALALGADAVCVGRALMDPLKENGAEGVADKIRRMTGELASVMARCGYHSLDEIDDECLYGIARPKADDSFMKGFLF